MRIKTTERGFRVLEHDTRENEPRSKRLIQESSAIGDYEHSLDEPGSSYLWVGDDHHLNREEVEELIGHMQTWLDTHRLAE